MKRKILLYLSLLLPVIGSAEEQEAMTLHLNTFGCEEVGEKQLMVKIDLDGDGELELLFAFSKTSMRPESGFITWEVFQKKDGKWTDGPINTIEDVDRNFKTLNFWPDSAGFVTLPKLNKKGILTKFGKSKVWFFTYMEDGVLKSMDIEDPAKINSTDEKLTALCESNKIIVKENDIP
jgi:hypothetical protein